MEIVAGQKAEEQGMSKASDSDFEHRSVTTIEKDHVVVNFWRKCKGGYHYQVVVTAEPIKGLWKVQFESSNPKVSSTFRDGFESGPRTDMVWVIDDIKAEYTRAMIEVDADL